MFATLTHSPYLTSTDIFGAFGRGESVSLFDPSLNSFVYGKIQAIRLESGYSEGNRPIHLLVTLTITRSPDGMVGTSRELYVRLAD